MCKGPGIVRTDAAGIGEYECFVFDCDGVLWHGEEAIEGAVELVANLQRRGKKVFFVTNASKKSRTQFHQKFQRLGFAHVRLEQCFPSGYFCASYLRSRVGADRTGRLFVIGGDGLRAELALEGFEVHGGEEEGVDVDETMFNRLVSEVTTMGDYDGVVVGFDSAFNYHKLCKASIVLQVYSDAFLCATNEDAFVKVGNFGMPGNGATAAIVKYCLDTAGRAAESQDGRYFVTGKPDPKIIDFIMKQGGVTDKAKVLMVGDRLDTDIQMAHNADIHSCFVLSGCSRQEDLTNTPHLKPNYIVESVRSLLTN